MFGSRNRRSITSRNLRRPAIESLEPRVLLSGMTFEAYYPEGFASDNINEFVPITNHNGVAVEYELHARYEIGDRDQLIARGTIPAFSRGGVTISDSQAVEDRLVRKDEPYALVLKATAPVSATMSHYDFGTAIGESFTTSTSNAWSFSTGRKDDRTRDFILVYNPDDSGTEVELTVYGANGVETTSRFRLEPQRRGGWALNDIPGLPDGPIAMVVRADRPIVAAQSHYQLDTERGFGAVGTPDGGALAGIVPAIDFDDDFYERNGDDSPHRSSGRHTANAYVSVLNTNSTAASIDLTFVFDDDDIPVRQQTIVVAAGSRATFSVRDFALPLSEEFGIVYRSNVPVTLSGSVYQGMDATGVEAASIAATTWDFGEGYMSRSRGGTTILENLYIFNPGAFEFDVRVEFYFTDGSTLQYTDSIDGYELDDIHLDRIDALRLRAEDQWYGIRVTAPAPIVAMLEHWDGGNGGGFSTFGMPSGTIVDFATAYTRP